MRSRKLELYEDGATNLNFHGAEAVHPFSEGVLYWQVDLGSRYAVEAIARYFAHGDREIFNIPSPSLDTMVEIDRKLVQDPRSVAVYLYRDKTDTNVASVFTSRGDEEAALAGLAA